MARVFSRALMSSHCMFLQLPAPVRQCSALHASQTAAAAKRLFHPSLIAATRKPKSAVLKPVEKNTSQPRPRPSSPPKKARLPLQAQDVPPQAQTQESSGTETISHAETTSPQVQQTTPTPSPAIARSRAPAATPFHRAKTPHQAIIEELALRKEPTVLYTAASQTTFIVVCVFSTLFVTWISLVTWKNYETAINQGSTGLIGVAVVNSAVWIGIATYLSLGPVGLIKRVVAVPASRTGPFPAVYTPKPTLRFEPVALPLVKWPKPFEVELAHVSADRVFSREMESIAQKSKRAPGVMDEYFGWALNIWTAYLKMFARVQRFTQVRAGSANLKLDMRGCESLDNGRVLDQLIKVDTKPFNILKRMFMKE